ncbi:ribose-5-phosphate isomerase [Candidatus Adlerbacteria bacterium RIFCSPHIGHO2_01_FULL_54_23]|uniref:Ribose-5-phosphate isomerase n=3 Tax=Candidatus Adleribacteriota TaxID=1752736 RepID=A0A1F4Y166_9BACT|nr:MAG: Ribose-5-phosphate isomerase B [Candidatus Adlerbacteria bacterium GW2011_GWA1_54_10]KKW38036.1 MAG: Ribose-5-phosphate isomerase B [Candidatus Adlerbacteria bacterium GW2011_GWB1_54_7]OGC79453.1 MAG: ribose-5-phosphate isomerase [Candidatus Adlerbacteria bacterium RIFCSPHIGHO2_01_FULL_54_23]OGC87063.1 MAG: ribose-5-phosphate isomerase [Candidatus Adlerbacteria bacterium RIFCSPLOWO2_01_FULL_54_16]
MKIFIASDHAGYELKSALVDYLLSKGREVEDLGPARFNPIDDYPDYIEPCAKKVAENKDYFGIIIGLSGQGEAMAANRAHGARAAVFYGGPLDLIKLAREHNDANILSLSSRYVPPEEAKKAVELFLTTQFSGEERHTRRIKKLDD